MRSFAPGDLLTGWVVSAVGFWLLWCCPPATPLPLLAATVAAWVRADRAEAVAVGSRLDREPVSDRPWWEDDPRFRHRSS